jgi:hypothetical protein
MRLQYARLKVEYGWVRILDVDSPPTSHSFFIFTAAPVHRIESSVS